MAVDHHIIQDEDKQQDIHGRDWVREEEEEEDSLHGYYTGRNMMWMSM